MGSSQCAACGAPLEARLSFCTACGTRIAPPPEPASARVAPEPAAAQPPSAQPQAAPLVPPNSEMPTRHDLPVLTDPPPPVSDTGKRGRRPVTGPHRALRRYLDGVVVTPEGEEVADAPPDNHADPLPYASTDVLRRLGPYDLLREVGRGETGVVYVAFSRRLVKRCAVKVMLAGEHAPEDELRRLQADARDAGRLNHPNIVTVFDTGAERGRFYCAMPLIEGRSFRDQMLAAHRSLAPSDLAAAVRVLATISRAVDYAHERGVMHRDIKPGNILVDASGQPHLTDFGIARRRPAERSAGVAAGVVGTPSYMSPEQAHGADDLVGAPSDVFSLGAVLYDLCTGRPPFVSQASPNDTITTIEQLLTRQAEPAGQAARRHLGWTLPPDLEAICHRAIAHDPAERYASAGALAADLEAWLEDRPVSARPVTRRERVRKWVSRNRSRAAALAVTGTTLLVLASAFGFTAMRSLSAGREAVREALLDGALAEVGTLEQAIRMHMLEGRPDLARTLVQQLRKLTELDGVEVVRTDRTLAFSDLATRRAVQERLDGTNAVSWARDRWPGTVERVKTLREVALPAIDRAGEGPARRFQYEAAAWDSLLQRAQLVTREDEVLGERILTVLAPIANDEPCQVCHGDVEQGVYGLRNKVRAVLVVRRSLGESDALLGQARQTTLVVGATTAVALLALFALIVRLAGVGGRRGWRRRRAVWRPGRRGGA
ncbi:MAG: serine/threonine protein kinase [Deltaproteobacteria bacterium]|nr:serine/threonine protein kinase [Deltaproteobacteria bacterium]